MATADAASAKALREKEYADFQAQHADFSESIDACKKAVQALKARAADVPQSLLQLQQARMIPADTKALAESLLAMDSTSGRQAPEANAYEFQSGSVVAMLEKLTLRFQDERLALEKAEINAKSNYEVLMQQLEDNLKADGNSVSQKTSAKAGRLEDAATAKGDLAITEKAKADDEKILADTLAECHAKSEEFEKNQVLRAEEIEAIEKAMGIISSGAVAGHAETHLPALLQSRHKVTALTQLRSTAARKGDDARSRAAAYLQGRAARIGSRYLSVVASHVTEDPFGKVKKMIKDLLVRLMEEANQEADHHAYCTSEMAMNKQTREDKSAEADRLSAEVEELTAETARLASEISQLSDAIKELKGQQAEATKLRFEEKAANTQAVADAKEAQAAVEQAIEVLRSFYAGAGSAPALLQGRAHGSATGGIHSSAPYGGMGDESTGVLGMLDVILSDFTRLETETTSQEDQSASAYEHFMAESSEDAEVKATQVEHEDGRKQRAEELLRSAKRDLGLTQEELERAMDYQSKLKADCVDTGLSYEERKTRREEEVQSLKEALKILSGDAV
mmetsp:Transcript_74022/g.163656  ORF Transcript_74022/g.163656 Transcript_74022/m.163656 type:complete len:566 (+) Transcript_74022:423-2120(+)